MIVHVHLKAYTCMHFLWQLNITTTLFKYIQVLYHEGTFKVEVGVSEMVGGHSFCTFDSCLIFDKDGHMTSQLYLWLSGHPHSHNIVVHENLDGENIFRLKPTRWSCV